MKKFIMVTVLVMSVVLMGSLALGGPVLLPKHPGYPMGDFKDPVTGMSTANDPGQKAPSPADALEAAGRFDDPRVVNTKKENFPNVVYDFMKKEEKSSIEDNKR